MFCCFSLTLIIYVQPSKQAEKRHKKELAAIVAALTDKNGELRLQILIRIIQPLPLLTMKKRKR